MRKIIALIFALLMVTAACSTRGDGTIPGIDRPSPPTAKAATPAQATGDPVIVAAGDIACDPASSYFSGNDPRYCQDQKTADLIRNINPDKVIALGDLQYQDATISKFKASYGRSWGQPDIKGKTSPVVGNHEYKNGDAKGYREYFGNPGATDLAYSYKIGAWRVFAANSNCAELDKSGRPGSCSGQAAWIKKTMTENPTRCTIAAWHHPRRTNVSNHYPGTTTVAGLEQVFYDRGGEVVLNGHAHVIEVSNKITPSGANSGRGAKHFTIGSGGKEHMTWQSSTKPSWTHYRNNTDHAVLKMTLHPTSYDYEIIDVDGNVLFSGTRNCF